MQAYKLTAFMMSTPLRPFALDLSRQVKNSPSCLGYDGSVFQATFEAFSEVFGEEEAKGMVTRNPNLLAVRPTGFGGAINAKSDTMQMSYVIAATRYVVVVFVFFVRGLRAMAGCWT